ncbi:MAG: DUF3656 domain-containing protein [Oscillospiraceae bacterium]|nr:DUF3656 domain-containing protein [Oscillospiraceae bacterium]
MNPFKPEVLSPVGSAESLEAAVRSGADAVYLGLKEFSARRNAENFTMEELRTACEYCHIRNVKVYLTLNIMIRESELADALSTLKKAARAGIDGVILQDLGLARLAKQHIPDLPLHASTQMTVHSPSALNSLSKLGFSRVVLARELSLSAITEICKKAKELQMEIEVFVHGALCMSVSGQCLMSAIIGGRSGNRGLCAGPCRLPFAAQNGTGYDLSLKDLSLFYHIDKLQSIGVSSLKIEGRMKRPEYVAAATAACRAAVDTGFVPDELSKSLKNIFSRSGFTDGYLTENIGKEMFGIRTKEDVVSATTAFAPLHSLYRNERQSVPLSAEVFLKENRQTELILNDGKNTVRVLGDIPSAAKVKAADENSITASVSKMGGTPYYIEDIKSHIDDNLYIPASSLNTLRRSAVEALNEKRCKPPEYTILEDNILIPKTSVATTPKLIARFDAAEQIPEDTSNLYGIMLPIEIELPENLPDGVLLIADLPRGILSEDYIRTRLSLFANKGFTHAYCSNIALIEVAKELGFKVIGSSALNVANSSTAEFIKDMGADFITLSAELLLSECVKLASPIPKGIFAYGRLPLMLTRNCPIKNGRDCKDCKRDNVITDRMNVSFPVRCRSGFSEILNSTPIWLADRLIETKGLDFLILYFTDEESKDISKIINMYVSGGKPPESYTRGLYYRNLL